MNAAPRETRSTCPYCGVGCGVIIESTGTQITGVRGDPEHPANFGRLCSKGSSLHLSARDDLAQATRVRQPQRRLARGGALTPVGWDAAMDLASRELARLWREHGADAIGFYLSGQLLTEDYYVFNKLVKGLLGSNHLDTNSRLCMSSAVAAYKLTLGADAPPACYDDVHHASCLFISGSNTAFAHPILFRRIEDARAQNPAMKIVVVDPRRTDTAASADLHLALRPGTDVMLCHGMLHLMLREGWTAPDYIAAHTQGFDALCALVADCTPERVQEVCGIAPEDLHRAARWFAFGGRDDATGSAAVAATAAVTSTTAAIATAVTAAPATHGTHPARGATLSLYCQGLNQSSSGTAKNATLINLHLACAQIGRAGAGPFSLTGQPNAMGGREVGGMANLLSAHRDMANPAHRAEVAALWGVSEVPANPGKTAIEMFQAAADGEIKALWIACTNPAQSLPDQAMVRRALQRAEFVVVQEAFATSETCAFADLLLPATTWGEKEGTVTNSERRITRVRAAVPPLGEARHDWQIGLDLAQRLMCDAPEILKGKPGFRMDYADTEAIWNEHRESTRGRDLDITGLSYAQIEAAPQQWPMPAGRTQGTARLYEDGVFPTADGRARFAALPYEAVAEPLSPRYPFALNTGRLRDQWHGMTRTGLVAKLFGHVPEPAVQLHPEDLRALGVADGGLVHVTSPRGSLVLPASASRDVARQQAFIAMHWGQGFLSGRDHQGRVLAGVNSLTNPAFCPRSKQPELKHAAVRVLKADLPWTLLALAWFPAGVAAQRMQALRARMADFEFASCVPFADGTGDNARQGVLLRAACSEAPPLDCVLEIERLLDVTEDQRLRYLDARRVQLRSLRLRAVVDPAQPSAITEERRLDALLLAGDTSAEPWLRALLQQEDAVQHYGRRLLMTGRTPPVAVAVQGKIVCSCVGVRADAIEAELARGAGDEDSRLAALQGTLRCGTQCGSCVPELRRMIRLLAAPTPAQAA